LALGDEKMFFGINDVLHFSSDHNMNIVKNSKEELMLGKVETVHVFSRENRVLVLTRDSLKTDYLYGFDLEGNLIFKAAPPKNYHFWYLNGKQMACIEADDSAKKSPRSGWWFSIDLDNGNFTIGAPAY
jgi:hypothetical protein